MFYSINIPQWVYFQYLLLYNNWINWWSNIVDIKSLTITSIPNFKSASKNKKVELETTPLDDHENNIIKKNILLF